MSSPGGRRLTRHDLLPDRNRWAALYVLCAGTLMIVLDATIVNVALPSIQDDLDFSPSNLAWVVNAYLIAFGGLLLLAGRAGDLIGQRRVFLTGLAIFTAASIALRRRADAGDADRRALRAGRGGALTSAVVLGMIVTMFPQPREQAKALGVYGFVASAGGSIGLLAGGVLTDAIRLALDLPHQRADRRSPPACWRCGWSRPSPAWASRAGADLPGAVLLTARRDARRVRRSSASPSTAGRRSARSGSARSPPSRSPRSSSARRGSRTR